MGHDVDQRNQKDEFPHYCHQNRGLCISEGSEGHLTCHLNAEQKHGTHVDSQSRAREVQQRGI